ncbi:MAG: hypothetical protein A2W90_21035 [Bacteroidetes bacterium GWF2_42_66]|nr:MAG: hypothetical protein A2W92_12290 [Bacteroidetes bacterium GWA2_42_15]OFX99224.1 MAG: hypothetical protein A2W89_03715 [Bacteroidetes bacterium GWE2_42_39]OFY40620.1 MAG: hypothetical protein A2W90_21035 [Bacteroidetes bacterium GWF2_42_66]
MGIVSQVPDNPFSPGKRFLAVHDPVFLVTLFLQEREIRDINRNNKTTESTNQEGQSAFMKLAPAK